MSKQRKVLITGSHGFIGKSLLKNIQTNNSDYSIFTIDVRGNGIQHLRGDLNDESIANEVSRINPDIVVHLAGNVSVPTSLNDPKADFDKNLRGTLMLLLSLRETSCDTFVFATSGGAIYDATAPQPFHEDSPTKPISPYGISKLAAEEYVRVLCEEAGISWTSLAISNCYGDVRVQRSGVIFSLWDMLRKGERPIIYGESSSRDFVYISDVTSAIRLSIENPVNSRLNISSNQSTRILDIFHMLRTYMSVEIEPIIKGLELGHIAQNQLDNSLAKLRLGWSPIVELDEGIQLSLR